MEAWGIMRASGAKRVRVAAPSEPGPGLAEAPAASPLAAVAPPPAGDPVAATIAGLQQALEAVRGRLDHDPYANPIALLSLDILQLLSHGGLDDRATEALIQRLTREAFVARAETARRYLGELDPARNEASIRAQLAGLAQDEQGQRVPFATFDRRLQRVYYGFVFTAHPTFGRTMELQMRLAAAAFGTPAETGGAALDRIETHDAPPAGEARPRRGARAVLDGDPRGAIGGPPGLRTCLRGRT